MGILRTVWMAVFFLLYLFYTVFFLLQVKVLQLLGKEEKALEVTNQVTEKWARRLLKAAGIEVEVEGLENLPEEPVLLISNHQSMFDIPVLVGHINKGVAFVAKESLGYIPILGTWMKMMKCILIDRSDVRQTLRAFRKAGDIFERGQSLVIFPEGTRSKSSKLQSFRKGSFKIALREGVPILPVSVKDTYKLWEGNDYLIQPAKIKVTVEEPIYLGEISEEKTNNISDEVREIIAGNL